MGPYLVALLNVLTSQGSVIEPHSRNSSLIPAALSTVVLVIPALENLPGNKLNLQLAGFFAHSPSPLPARRPKELITSQRDTVPKTESWDRLTTLIKDAHPHPAVGSLHINTQIIPQNAQGTGPQNTPPCGCAIQTHRMQHQSRIDKVLVLKVFRL